MRGKMRIVLVAVMVFSLLVSASKAYACGGSGGKCGCMGENAPMAIAETHQCPGSCMCDVVKKK
jgi:hypothetical protein